MKRHLVKVCVSLLGLCLLVALPHGAVSFAGMYDSGEASFEGIGTFPIIGFHQNLTTPVGPQGYATGKPVFGPIVLAKELDWASPILFVKSAQGTTFKYVHLSFQDYLNGQPGEPYLKIELGNAQIVGIVLKNEPHSYVSRQEITINFDSIRWWTPDGEWVEWNLKMGGK